MAGPWVLVLPCLISLALHNALGDYIITSPRQWISPGTAQVCVFVLDPAAPAGSLQVSATIWDSSLLPEDRNQTLLEQTIAITAGKIGECHDIQVPESSSYSGRLHLSGTVSGVKLNRTDSLDFKKGVYKTFVQSDRYLYRPGEKVQFRILTLKGNNMRVSTDQYPEVWVTTPSRTRIAQWKNVTNTEGLVHLEFQLADEPEQGSYLIHVKTDEETTTRVFKVEEFVLPRFEVTVTPPPYILATDETFTFKVCANYTFGQPVKGNLSFTIHNKERKKCRAKLTTNSTIFGCNEVSVKATDMKIIDCNVYSVQAKAVVAEEGTGVELSSGKSVSITRSAVSFKTIYKDEFMKPNLPYSLKLKAEQPDGAPAAGVPVEVCAAGRCSNKTTASDGIFSIFLPNYDSYSVQMKALNCRANMHSSEFSENIQHYFSPSNSSLLIQAPENKLKCATGTSQRHVLPVFFSARNQTSASLTVQVVARGHIQHTSTREVSLTPGPLLLDEASLVEPLPLPLEGTVRGVLDLEVTLPASASPKAKVLVWYTRGDGEVVSDVRSLEVERCLANNVTLSWSTPRAQPGDSATLSLAAEPESVCSLGVVDRSSELLAQDPDPINIEKIFDFAEGFNIYPWARSQINDEDYCRRKNQPPVLLQDGPSILPLDGPRGARSIIRPFPNYYSSYVDALKMFSDAGVFVFTDLTVETRPCEKDETFQSFSQGNILESDFVAARPPPQAFAIGGGFGGADPDREGDGSSASVQAPRTNFPETWLWELVAVPASGVQQQQVTLPDTITQWVGKAVCVHPGAGVGLSARQPVVTFTPFFVDLTLPPTVKRGEVLPVKMSVFNYLDQSLPVSVTLENSPEYEILEEPGAGAGLGVGGAPAPRGKRSACVPPRDKVVLTVRVRPQEIGDVNLTVSAAVDPGLPQACGTGTGADLPQRSDALVRPIKVEAEGFLRENSWTKYVCSEDLQPGGGSQEVWELVLPATLVEGSARGWVTAVGDLLALSLENLGSLIRMPYGCGEQNMLNFAPNIYILRYLRTTRQATPEATAKLLRYMTTGYQRELLYRRDNGSFSAFGNADDSGSTWLTAFVLKSFSQAREYIQVDEEQLKETREWLLQQQAKDGCFNSVGKLLHKGMQGGVATSSTPTPLTAYVLVSLLEAGEHASAPPLDLAAQCLTADSSTHPYTLALKAYALALGRRPEAAAAVTRLLDASVNTSDSTSTYWELPAGPGKSRAAALETAGYAILAMMTHDPENLEPRARMVVKWITTQRNGQGGFHSTQDTVVALQALATYESHLHQGPLNVAASVSAKDLAHTFTVTDHNKLLQQLVPLPTVPTNVTLDVTGEGCAVLQAVLRYNIPKAEPSDAFDLTVNTITVPDQGQCITKRITACASYRLPDGQSESNMVVIEVDLISGYVPIKDDLKQLLKDDRNLKRYDVDGSKVLFYVDELTRKDTCVNFRVTRDVDMEDVKNGTVVVYDYYQPEFSVSQRYTLPANNVCR